MSPVKSATSARATGPVRFGNLTSSGTEPEFVGGRYFGGLGRQGGERLGTDGSLISFGGVNSARVRPSSSSSASNGHSRRWQCAISRPLSPVLNHKLWS